MKLRNKKTGEVAEFEDITRVFKFIGNQNTYNSLAEFIEEWEDYKEKGWYITENGEVRENRSIGIVEEESEYREIGNYFETEEEAEKAVEKLKAWKRLKDNGFEFTGWDRYPDYSGDFRITASDRLVCDNKDLDLLFGGEE